MIVVVLVFGVPLIVAATMLSPAGLDDVLSGSVTYTAIMLVLMPFVAWPIFLAQTITGPGRFRGFIGFWLGGAVLGTSAVTFIAAVLEYSPTPSDFDPNAHLLIPYTLAGGLLLGAFVLCMLVSMGFWGVAARLAPRGFLIRGAIVTGLLLFGGVSGIGYALWPEERHSSVPISFPRSQNPSR